MITHYQVMSADVVARAHAAGMRALVYTVNGPWPAHWLIGMEIDGIVTDAVDRFSPAG